MLYITPVNQTDNKINDERIKTLKNRFIFFSDNEKVLKVLIDNGANVNHADKIGKTPLFNVILLGAIFN